MQVSLWFFPATCLVWRFQMPPGRRSTSFPVSAFWNKIMPTIRVGRLSFRKVVRTLALFPYSFMWCRSSNLASISSTFWKRRVFKKITNFPSRWLFYLLFQKGVWEPEGVNGEKMVGNHGFQSTLWLCRCVSSGAGGSVDIAFLC